MRIAIQWLHLLSAIVAIGGSFFLRFVLLPASRSLDEVQQRQLTDGVMKRFRPILWVSIAVLFFTGLYNVGMVAMRGGLAAAPAYLHILLTKILLALVIFGIAFLLTTPGDLFSSLKTRRKQLLAVNVVLAVIVVFLSAYLRRM